MTKPGGLTKLSSGERAVQRQIVDGLRARNYEVIITHDAKHKPVHIGITDLIVPIMCGVMFIEVKGEDGKASEEQMSFLARMRAMGHVAIVARNWDDVERQL